MAIGVISGNMLWFPSRTPTPDTVTLRIASTLSLHSLLIDQQAITFTFEESPAPALLMHKHQVGVDQAFADTPGYNCFNTSRLKYLLNIHGHHKAVIADSFAAQ